MIYNSIIESEIRDNRRWVTNLREEWSISKLEWLISWRQLIIIGAQCASTKGDFHVPSLSIDGGVIFLSKFVCLISFNNVNVVPLAYSC